MDPTALPGYRKASFVLPFGGGDIWIEHLDGLYEYTALAVEKWNRDALTFCRPSLPSLLAVNIAETDGTESLAAALSAILGSGKKRFTRVAFVGAGRPVRRSLKAQLCNAGFALAFIDDFEKAKEWLVSERSW